MQLHSSQTASRLSTTSTFSVILDSLFHMARKAFSFIFQQLASLLDVRLIAEEQDPDVSASTSYLNQTLN